MIKMLIKVAAVEAFSHLGKLLRFLLTQRFLLMYLMLSGPNLHFAHSKMIRALYQSKSSIKDNKEVY